MGVGGMSVGGPGGGGKGGLGGSGLGPSGGAGGTATGGAGGTATGGAGGIVPGGPVTGVVAVASGSDLACVLVTGGTARCWGDNVYGGWGAGTNGLTNRTIASSVKDLSGVTAVGAGFDFACALTGGTVQCWGRNSNGTLGNATMTDARTPVPVTGLAGTVTAISVGFTHACALLTSGTVQCWGSNFSGELGNGTMTGSATPVAVTGLTGVTAISAVQGSTCALLTGGTVECWGKDATTSSLTPVAVTGLTGVTAVSTPCALLTGGTVACWGDNSDGQLGNGTMVNSSVPVMVTGLSGAVTEISSNGSFACALLAGGTVQCWGNNYSGELGDGTTTNSSTPVAVTGLLGVTGVSVGGDFTCAVLAGGTVDCWGGEGGGYVVESATPVGLTNYQ